MVRLFHRLASCNNSGNHASTSRVQAAVLFALMLCARRRACMEASPNLESFKSRARKVNTVSGELFGEVTWRTATTSLSQL